MAGESTNYERFVRDIVEALLRAQGLETVVVQHDVQVRGLSRSHQVDVYWEYRIGGVLHRVIINCKRYAGTVEVTDVNTLNGVLTDMPGVRGLIVTTVGFQKGAVDVATTHQVGLKVIRPPEDADWEGRIREIRFQMRFDVPELVGCSVAFDQEWVKANIPGDPEALVEKAALESRATTVRDLLTGEVSDMIALWNRAMWENPTGPGGEGKGILRWEDARFERPGAPPVKVNAIGFRWRIKEGPSQAFLIRSEPKAIVRDAIAGTLLFIDPSGVVSGDVEEELGRERSE